MLLAVVLGAGAIPIARETTRFPDAGAWPGTGAQRVGNMLVAVAENQGNQLRSSGPGPQQLAARWQKKQLNPAERLAVLLGGASFHHPALIPAYADALRSASLRERQAALVGLAWLLGDRPGDPTSVPENASVWDDAARFADSLAVACRERSLVGIWVDSFLAAKGMPSREGLVFRRDAAACLSAIREIAGPEDLGELLALWPLLERRERFGMTALMEVVLVQRFTTVPQRPNAPSGEWVVDLASQYVDLFVEQACASPEGIAMTLGNIAALHPDATRSQGAKDLLLAAVAVDYPPAWIVAAELLTAYGAPARSFNRQRPDDPRNKEERRAVLEALRVTDEMQRQLRPSRLPAPNRRN